MTYSIKLALMGLGPAGEWSLRLHSGPEAREPADQKICPTSMRQNEQTKRLGWRVARPNEQFSQSCGARCYEEVHWKPPFGKHRMNWDHERQPDSVGSDFGFGLRVYFEFRPSDSGFIARRFMGSLLSFTRMN